jgi:hypothetical protein
LPAVPGRRQRNRAGTAEHVTPPVAHLVRDPESGPRQVESAIMSVTVWRHVPGLRGSCVMLVSSEGDPKAGKGPGRVAAVVAQRGVEVDWPSTAEPADGQVARLVMTCGVVPVRAWEPSSAKVTSRTWCNASIAQCPRTRSARRAGLAWRGEAVIAETTTVHHLRAPRSGLCYRRGDGPRGRAHHRSWQPHRPCLQGNDGRDRARAVAALEDRLAVVLKVAEGSAAASSAPRGQ